MIHSKALTFKNKYIITSFQNELTLYHTIPGQVAFCLCRRLLVMGYCYYMIENKCITKTK